MNHSKVYQYRFAELLKIIRRGSVFHDSEEREDDRIIDICGNGFREYQSTVSSNETWAIYVVEKIVQGLLDLEKVKFFSCAKIYISSNSISTNSSLFGHIYT